MLINYFNLIDWIGVWLLCTKQVIATERKLFLSIDYSSARMQKLLSLTVLIAILINPHSQSLTGPRQLVTI